MRITLTSEQSQVWEEGGWAAWRVEEDVLEWADAQQITEPVVVALDNGAVAFAFMLGEVL